MPAPDTIQSTIWWNDVDEDDVDEEDGIDPGWEVNVSINGREFTIGEIDDGPWAIPPLYKTFDEALKALNKWAVQRGYKPHPDIFQIKLVRNGNGHA